MRRAALLSLFFLSACEGSCASCGSSAGSGAPPSSSGAASAAPVTTAASRATARPAPTAPAEAPAPASAAAPPEEPPEVQPVSAEEAQKLRCSGAQARAETGLRRWPSRPLEELRRGGDARGGFDTEGVVTDTFLPVPCTEGAQCKSQPPPHAVLAPLDGASGTFIGMTASAGEITIGDRLRFSVILCGSKTYGGTINEGEIVAIGR